MLHVGFNNYVTKDEVTHILDNRTGEAKRIRDEARKKSPLSVLDFTKGKKGWSLLRLKGGVFVISVVHTTQLVARMDIKTAEQPIAKRNPGRPRNDGTPTRSHKQQTQ